MSRGIANVFGKSKNYYTTISGHGKRQQIES